MIIVDPAQLNKSNIRTDLIAFIILIMRISSEYWSITNQFVIFSDRGDTCLEKGEPCPVHPDNRANIITQASVPLSLSWVLNIGWQKSHLCSATVLLWRGVGVTFVMSITSPRPVISNEVVMSWPVERGCNTFCDKCNVTHYTIITVSLALSRAGGAGKWMKWKWSLASTVSNGSNFTCGCLSKLEVSASDFDCCVFVFCSMNPVFYWNVLSIRQRQLMWKFRTKYCNLVHIDEIFCSYWCWSCQFDA